MLPDRGAKSLYVWGMLVGAPVLVVAGWIGVWSAIQIRDAKAHQQPTVEVIQPTPDPIPSMEIPVGDGPIRDWLANIAARVKQNEDAVSRIGPLEALVDRLERTVWKLFRICIGSLIGVFVLMLGVSFLKDYAIRKLYAIATVFCLCCTPALAQEPDNLAPDVVMYVPDFKCDACDVWKVKTLPEVLKKGSRVLVALKTGFPRYPTFFVLNNENKWVKVVGGLSLQQVDQIKGSK